MIREPTRDSEVDTCDWRVDTGGCRDDTAPCGDKEKGPAGRTLVLYRAGPFLNVSSAVSYSPTTLRLQYHRRCQA